MGTHNQLELLLMKIIKSKDEWRLILAAQDAEALPEAMETCRDGQPQ